MAREKLVYSVGHSSLSAAALVETLHRFDIGCLVDVRRYPGSRRHPHFGRRRLEARLAKNAIDYVFLGEELGGYLDVPYERHVTSAVFEKGLGALEGHARRTVSAFMCAEKNPWQCHRRFIAQALEKRGWTVRHMVGGELLVL